jgi:hypothetical protein
MTVYSASQGVRKPLRTKVTTTSATTIYTGGSFKAYLDAINFGNITASPATIDLWVNDGSSSFYILKGYSIAGAASLQMTELAVDVNNGDTLRVQSDTANAIDVVGVMVQQVASQG